MRPTGSQVSAAVSFTSPPIQGRTHTRPQLRHLLDRASANGKRAQVEVAGRTPISAVDVARAVAVILDDSAPHIGHIYDLTGPESIDLNHYARVFSEVLGRPIHYRDASLPAWSESLRQMRFPEHVVRHLLAMAELTKQGRYDRMTDTMSKLTGEAPMNMRDFVKLHAAEFKQRESVHP